MINKVFEKILHARLLSYLRHIRFFYGRQYGFRSNSSTSSCVIDLVDYIYGELDKGNYVSGLFLDLSKAFDSVDHQILFRKLEVSGVRGVALDLFRDYLRGRGQFVDVGGAHSGARTVGSGVPQGSCLGPLLFLVYVNDLCSVSTNGRTYMFADDTALFYLSQDILVNCSNAEDDLHVVNNYFGSNGLSLSINKTKLMHFCSPGRVVPPVTDVTLNGTPIETVTEFKYLGLILDPCLKWGSHINQLAAKIRRTVGTLYRTRRLLPRNIRLLVYHSMIHSSLTYVIEAWGCATMSRVSSLQKIQNRALRNVYDIPYLTPRMTIYQHICPRILPIRALYARSAARFVYKRIHGLVLSDQEFRPNSHTYFSRNREMLQKPRCNNEISKNRMSFAGPSVFNELPNPCKNAPNLRLFSDMATEFLTSQDQLERHLRY